MAIRSARVEWTGDFKAGQGIIKAGSGTFKAHYSFGSMFRDADGTNPMEMLASSLASCFSGALAAYLSNDGFAPKLICTDAEVDLRVAGDGSHIAAIYMIARAEVAGLEKAAFLEYAERAKRNCPVAKALNAVEITLQAELM